MNNKTAVQILRESSTELRLMKTFVNSLDLRLWEFLPANGVSKVWADRCTDFARKMSGTRKVRPVSVSKEFPLSGRFVIETEDGARYALKLRDTQWSSVRL